MANKARLGWYLYDWANSAFSTTIVTVFFGPYITQIARFAADGSGRISVLGMPVQASAYFPFLVTISVVLQILVFPFIGAAADFFGHKKRLFLICAYIGALASTLLYGVTGALYMYGGLLFIIANVAFGASIVLYNSYLNKISDENDRDKVSSIGWAFGYLGGGLLLLLNLVLFSSSATLGITKGQAVRISLASAGVWWAIFTIFTAVWLPNVGRDSQRAHFSLKEELSGLKATIQEMRSQPNTLMFLVAFLLFNDGVQTVITLSSQFGQEELKLPIDTLTKTILLVQFVAFAGTLIFRKLARRYGAKTTILASLVVWIAAILYAYGLLHTQNQFFVLAILIGLVLGGTQALSRSLFSRLIPAGKEAEYFSFYEISDKGTSWIGPLVFGLSLQLTNNFRVAILSLAFLFIAGFFFLLKVNVTGIRAKTL